MIRRTTPRNTVFNQLWKKQEFRTKDFDREWMRKLPDTQKVFISELDNLIRSSDEYKKAVKFKDHPMPFDNWIKVKTVFDAAFCYWAVRQAIWISRQEYGVYLSASFSDDCIECCFINEEREIYYRCMFLLDSKVKFDKVLDKYEEKMNLETI